jgi:four helix bundle protein
MATRFEELRTWQNARVLTRKIYELSNKERFAKDWALKDQIRRASISIMSNIAEGFESRTRAQFIAYLGNAKASAGEVRCQLYIAQDQRYIDSETFDEVYDLADKVSRQLHRLIDHLKKSRTADTVRELPAEYLSR